MLRQHAFMSFSYFFFEHFVNIFPCFFEVYISHRDTEVTEVLCKDVVAHEGVLMLNR